MLSVLAARPIVGACPFRAGRDRQPPWQHSVSVRPLVTLLLEKKRIAGQVDFDSLRSNIWKGSLLFGPAGPIFAQDAHNLQSAKPVAWPSCTASMEHVVDPACYQEQPAVSRLRLMDVLATLLDPSQLQACLD